MLATLKSILTRWGTDMARVAALLLIGYAILEYSINLAVALEMPALADWGLKGGFGFFVVALSHVLRRLLMPGFDFRVTLRDACANGQSGRAAIAGAIVIAALLMAVSSPRAGELPPGAVENLPVLGAQVDRYWPDADRATLAGQVEKETCVTMTHRMCWSPKAELKTAREQGIGLGQCTRTERFDCLAEQKAKWPEDLREWSWDTPALYRADLQLRALVLMDRTNYERVVGAATEADRWAMTLVSYNAGPGRVDSNRRVCAATKGCDPQRWFNHAEHTTTLKCEKLKGYGQCFALSIPKYPRDILFVRRERYLGAV